MWFKVLCVVALALTAEAWAADPPVTTVHGGLQPLAPGAVKVGGELGRRIELTINGNLLKLDVERDFLAPLKQKKGEYIGVGILLDVACRLAAATGDKRVADLRDRIARALIESQSDDGYIGYKRPPHRVWQAFDPDEMSQIMLGLVSYHRCTGDKAALSATRKLADFVIATMRSDPKQVTQGVADPLRWLGIDYALMSVHEATGEPAYRDFCVQDRRLPDWPGPIVLGRWGRIEGHAYGHLIKCMGQLRLYHVTGDARLLEPTRRAVDCMTRQDGMVITGAVSETECWHDTQDGSGNLGETCATTYVLLVLDELLRVDGTSAYGDLIERIVYNTLFAAQSPDGRQIRYFTPFEGPRSYHPVDTFCCPNNFRRAIALLPEVIYYRAEGGVAVNLYTASTAKVPLGGGLVATLRQETDYPGSGRVVIHVDAPAAAGFPVWLRIPAWCAEPRVSVNGRPVEQPIVPGRFLVIKRPWKAADRIELDLPMAWRWVKGRQAQAGRVALMRGPLVYCLDPSRHKELAGADLRQLMINAPTKVEGPLPDDSVRPGGMKARVWMWRNRDWSGQKNLAPVELTEFADAGGRATYFRIANPRDASLVNDELRDTSGAAQ